MLKVYMTGLIYLNGCDEDVKRAYAPDGTGEEPPHYASLFIAADQIEATDWWSESKISHDKVVTIEFRIPAPSYIWFPDVGNAVSCIDLDDKLPKLKKKKAGKDYDFDVDPGTAQAIAQVTIRGGSIQPCRFKNIGLVEWTIAPQSALTITAVKKDGSDSRTIRLKPPAGAVAAEVVFANTHDFFSVDEKGSDPLAGDHVGLFVKLSPEPDVTVVSKKAPGSVGKLKTDNAILNLMRKNAHTEGDTPNCCTP
jgi:hypothetical protein